MSIAICDSDEVCHVRLDWKCVLYFSVRIRIEDHLYDLITSVRGNIYVRVKHDNGAKAHDELCVKLFLCVLTCVKKFFVNKCRTSI